MTFEVVLDFLKNKNKIEIFHYCIGNLVGLDLVRFAQCLTCFSIIYCVYSTVASGCSMNDTKDLWLSRYLFIIYIIYAATIITSLLLFYKESPNYDFDDDDSFNGSTMFDCELDLVEITEGLMIKVISLGSISLCTCVTVFYFWKLIDYLKGVYRMSRHSVRHKDTLLRKMTKMLHRLIAIPAIFFFSMLLIVVQGFVVSYIDKRTAEDDELTGASWADLIINSLIASTGLFLVGVYIAYEWRLSQFQEHIKYSRNAFNPSNSSFSSFDYEQSFIGQEDDIKILDSACKISSEKDNSQSSFLNDESLRYLIHRTSEYCNDELRKSSIIDIELQGNGVGIGRGSSQHIYNVNRKSNIRRKNKYNTYNPNLSPIIDSIYPNSETIITTKTTDHIGNENG